MTKGEHMFYALLIDDKEGLRDRFRFFLEMNGYLVIEARNGSDGLAAFIEFERAINLVITDLEMPDGPNGFDVVKEIRKINKMVPVILASGTIDDANSPNARKALEVGADTFLKKPCTDKDIEQAIKTAASNRKNGTH